MQTIQHMPPPPPPTQSPQSKYLSPPAAVAAMLTPLSINGKEEPTKDRPISGGIKASRPCAGRKSPMTAQTARVALAEERVLIEAKRTDQANALRYFLGSGAGSTGAAPAPPAAVAPTTALSDAAGAAGAAFQCLQTEETQQQPAPTPTLPVPQVGNLAAATASGERERALVLMRQLLRGRRPVLFLDYDGTLAPIVSDPEKAFMAPGMREVRHSDFID
jgi:hypothetical protein